MIFYIIVALALTALVLLEGNVAQPGCPPPPAPSDKILAMAKAIAVAEGSNPEWNNPGDLTLSFGFPTSGVANSAGVLIFDKCEDGWSALYHQLSLIVSGNSRYTVDMTIAEFGAGYSGGDPNWALNVSNALGVPEDTPLGEVLA